MRSRTECVTTTYASSSDDDQYDSDESDDWQPSESAKRKAALKRKLNTSLMKKISKRIKRKKSSEEEISQSDECDKEDDSEENFYVIPTSITKKPTNKRSETQNGVFKLYVNINDIDENYKENSKLSLWKRDGSTLLQKFIRVKTPNFDEFIFTTSTVYSSWGEERRKEFKEIGVKYISDNKKRVTIVEPENLKFLLKSKENDSLDIKTEGSKCDDIEVKKARVKNDPSWKSKYLEISSYYRAVQEYFRANSGSQAHMEENIQLVEIFSIVKELVSDVKVTAKT